MHCSDTCAASVLLHPQWGRGGSGKNKLAMRVLVHPFICEIAMCILRNFARQLRGVRGGMGSLLFVVLLVIRSIYGRFLLVRTGCSICCAGGALADSPALVLSAPSPKRGQCHTAPGLHFSDGLHRAHVHQGHGRAVRFTRALAPRGAPHLTVPLAPAVS